MKNRGLIAAFALAAAMAFSPFSEAAFDTDTSVPLNAMPRSGDRTLDGAVNAGISPDTHEPFYTTPADAPGTYTWDGAESHCNALEALGRQDWRVPTKGELAVEFENRAAIGGFNETGTDPAGWYWASAPHSNFFGWAMRFSDGFGNTNEGRYDASSLRCVRG